MPLVQFDELEEHIPLEHLALEIARMYFPLSGLPYAEPRFLAETRESVIGCESTADGLVILVRLSFVNAL